MDANIFGKYLIKGGTFLAVVGIIILFLGLSAERGVKDMREKRASAVLEDSLKRGMQGNSWEIEKELQGYQEQTESAGKRKNIGIFVTLGGILLLFFGVGISKSAKPEEN